MCKIVLVDKVKQLGIEQRTNDNIDPSENAKELLGRIQSPIVSTSRTVIKFRVNRLRLA